MTVAQNTNKAKIAKRVVEIFEFIDEENREVTVMDIVRRYDWPQSSTSELLASLVELGLLYKNPFSRTYTLSQRAAMLGSGCQPAMVRDGRLTHMIDRLVIQTGLNVATFGIVGVKSQIFSWRAGVAGQMSGPVSLSGGVQERLTDSAAGWLLLSTIAQPRRDGMVRRLLADMREEIKPSFADMSGRVSVARDQGHATGPVGCGSSAQVTAVLLPGQPEGRPLAIGFVYEPSAVIEETALLRCLRDAITAHVELDNTPAPLSFIRTPRMGFPAEPERMAV
jgi:DNA-binding IclR family transcriptional regulator